MTNGSQAFPGEGCQFYVEKKGGTEYNHSLRVLTLDSTGFARKTNYDKTFGAHLLNYQGYSPATIKVNFVLDVDDSSDAFMDFIGSGFTVSSVTQTVLEDSRTPTFYKVKFQFNNYKGTFGVLGTNDESVREIFYNAYGVSVQPRASTDSEVEGTLTFQVNPFNEIGSSNFIEIRKTSGDTVSNFNTRESNYDTIMGY